MGSIHSPVDVFSNMGAVSYTHLGLTVTYIDRILDVTDYVNEQLKTDDDRNGTNYLSPKYLKTVADRFAKSEGCLLYTSKGCSKYCSAITLPTGGARYCPDRIFH